MHKRVKQLGVGGFTVIELLISIGVIALVIPSLAVAVNNLTVLNKRTRDVTLSNIVAENKAELLRNSGFNSLTPGTYDFTNELPSELASPKSASYTLTNTEPGVIEIDVTITYRDYGNPRTQTYKTAISELGVAQ